MGSFKQAQEHQLLMQEIESAYSTWLAECGYEHSDATKSAFTAAYRAASYKSK